MRDPFFNITRLSLEEGQSDFHPLEGREGLVVTLGPNTAFFDRPGRSVCRWPGTKTIPYRSPHHVPKRWWIGKELNALSRFLWGGGDVKLNMIKTLEKQREILLTAGLENVVEKIDLADHGRQGAPPLRFLQPAYLCSSINVEICAVPCDASTMSWTRAPYVYFARPLDSSKPAIVCLSGRTMVWSERLEPGESRDFALGNVIAATANVTSKLRPTSQCHPDDYKAAVYEDGHPAIDAYVTQHEWLSSRTLRERVRRFAAASKILVDSIRAREGFFVCEMTNHSTKPAFVYIQINKSGLYGGSGLIGLAIKVLSSFFRWFHLPAGDY